MRSPLYPCALALVAFACQSPLDLPPAPGATTLSGRLVVSEAGTGLHLPAKGAAVEVLRTNLSTRTDADGRFVLGPVAVASGTVSLRFDADGDGSFEHQRLVDLAELLARRSGNVDVGDVALGENAFVRGRATLSGVTGATGDDGITVYVPGTPYEATTTPDGNYLLRDLPAGTMDLAAYKPGYAPAIIANATLGSGQVLTARDLVLEPLPASPPPAGATGRVVRANGSPAGLDVSLVKSDTASSDPAWLVAQTKTATDGTYHFDTIAPGLYDLQVTGGGLSPMVVPHLLVAAAGTSFGDVEFAPGQSPATGPGAPSAGDGGAVNHPPTAKVVDEVAVAGEATRLDASGSSDPDGDALTFTWVQLDGPTVALDVNASTLAARPVFVAPATAGTLSFGLTVTDAFGATATATAHVVVKARPVAVVAPTLLVPPGATGTLDGSASSDADPTATLTFAWTVLDVADGQSPPIVLSSATDAKPTFVAPSSAGVLVKVQLVVSDGALESLPAVVRVYTSGANLPPVADAGEDLDLDFGETAVLDPSGSFDPDGTLQQFYQWNITGAPCGTIGGVQPSGKSNQTNGTATFTAPAGRCDTTVELKVYDNAGATATDDLVVRVRDRQEVQVSSATPQGPGANAFGPVRVTFARDVDATTLSGALEVTDGANPVAGSVAYDTPTRTISFVPSRPFPPAETISVRLDGVSSTEGLGLAGGEYAFTFSSLAPALQVEEQVDAEPSWGSVFAAGGQERFLTYSPNGNCANVARDGGHGWNLTQVCAVGAATDPMRVYADEWAHFAQGRYWMGRADNNCPNNVGTRQSIVRATPLGGTNTGFNWSVLTYSTTGAVYPGANCAATRWTAGAVDDNAGLWVGSIDLVASTTGGPLDSLAVRAFSCPTCNQMVDGSASTQPAPSAYVELPAPVPATKNVVRALSMDERQGTVAMVWIADDGAGGKLRGASYDEATKSWTAFAGDSGADLNGSGTADLPTARFAPDGTLYVAYVETGLTPAVRVLRHDESGWRPVGGALSAAAPDLERLSLATTQDSVFVGWSEPAGTLRAPHVAWFDESAAAWRAPGGTGPGGELPLPSGCHAGRPFLAPTGDGAGMELAYGRQCGSTGATMVRAIR